MRIQLSEHFTFKKLLAFVAPSIVMMVFTSVYSVVDGLFVSNVVGADAVAAIARIFPVIIVLGSIGFMIGAGGSALVAKTLGEGDKERANSYFSFLVYVTLAIGTVIAVAGQFAVPSVARLLGAEGKTYDYCVLYGRVLLGAQPFFILQNIFQSFFVAAEKPALGLIVTAAAGVTNIILDAVFIIGFKWGLAGAAAATAASQVLGGVFPVIYFAMKNKSLLRLTKTKFYARALLKSCANGSSEFLSNVSAAVITMLYNFQVDKFEGDAGVAAYGAIAYVTMVFYSLFMGYTVGSAPIIAYNYGAQNKAELKNLFKKSLIIITVTGLLMTALSQALGYPFVKMFGYNDELFKITLRGFRIYSFVFIIVGFNMFGSSLFTALNNGPVSAAISSLRIAFCIAAVLVFPLAWGIDGVWAAANFAELFAIATTLLFVFLYRKKYGY
ncbi:MAG: polysaccharide biosynthesis C-terminal domain-containing protein [Clostridia bacterium]|nr:polysaccharide biosynthesis C-terminal domain-containing protein [Clostridia bacterium]